MTNLINEYEKHINNISEKYKKLIQEHRDYIINMREDLISIWLMAKDNKSSEEIKQYIQNIINERFGFSPKKASKNND